MYATKGFVAHSQFENVSPGAVSPIGEITTQSLTFSRETAKYVSAAAPKLTYHSFLSSNNGTLISVPAVLSDHILAVTKRLYDRTMSSAGQQFADVLLQDLLDTFAANAENFTCGAMVTDGTYWMPEWIGWTTKNLDLIPTDNAVRIWFSDPSFQLQYDEYEIVIDAPTDRLDDFFKTGAEVEAMLKAITTQAAIDRIQSKRATSPETILASKSYNYYDPYNANRVIPTSFIFLIYGQAGNNTDAWSDKLAEFILANSTHTRDEWIKIFPDIFKRTEYVIVPRFDLEAIPNRLPMVGIYSPVVDLTSGLSFLTSFVSGYQGTHINSNAQALAHPYQSLQLLVIGGPDNRDAKYKFTDKFPDYIDVSSQVRDFDRMSVYTKTFLLQLESHIILAETTTEFSSIPQGYSRSKRDGKLYLSRAYDNINYLVATKSNFKTT